MGDRTALDEATIDRIVEFHGHMCPGLAMGIQAARIALERIGPHSRDEEVVTVTETDMCGVDAVQFLTGCTFGKGNLIHEDWGKNAFTFFRRSDGKAVRVVARPGAFARDPEHQELFAKVRAGTATPEERARFGELHVASSRRVLALEPEDLYEADEFMGMAPPRARIHDSVQCARCNEGTMVTRITEVDGRPLCPPCLKLEQAGAAGDPVRAGQGKRMLL